MHKRLVFNLIARNLLIVCLTMLAPLGWAVHDQGHSKEVAAFIISILLGVLLASLLLWAFRLKPGDFEKVNAKDGLAIVGLSWLCLSAFGALPLYLADVVGSYTDAFFEITSGFTTTGATILTDIEALPRGILFWRSLTHWLGGMGLIVLYLALLPALGQGAFRLYKAEAPGLTVEKIEPKIRATAKTLWSVYFLFSLLEVLFLKLGGMSLFDALCHTFATMSTGGFSTRNASIAAFGPTIQWVIVLFMFLAGTNFLLHYYALRGKFKEPFRNEEFRAYLFLILILIPIFTLVLTRTQASLAPFRDATFQIIAILTTTGFTTANFDAWPHVLRFGLILLMFIGGCGGSTGGGMKVIRVLLSIKLAARSITQAIFPNAVLPIKFNNVPLKDRMILAVGAYFVIFISLFFFGTACMTLTESCDLVTALSLSIASLSNIGPGLGKIGPAHNYAWLSLPGKWILTFLMLAGRLELYSILILVMPATWKK